MSADQGDQQFCLRWNDFQTNMVASFKHLRDEKSFCDVTIATEGQHTKAHKMILCACRLYFWSIIVASWHFLLAVRISRICWSRTLPSTPSSSWKMFPSPISPPSWSSCTLERLVWFLILAQWKSYYCKFSGERCPGSVTGIPEGEILIQTYNLITNRTFLDCWKA